ncbi:phosphonopyruvate decarboxylase [Candidatus Woesearchaeota archaeon]|nr:phosphonopyruvate decarboxylase [Candidatus Woesearchaeota archaeon]
MISCEKLFNVFKKQGLEFFTGVPDSFLKDFCSYINDHAKSENHIITANEGGAIALVTGYHLATGNIGVAYMQNSGEGNAVNPLVSLADPEVYSIPMLLLIGWRGEPGIKDEPQHVKQGKITIDLLNVLGIQYEILPDSINDAEKSVENIVNKIKEKNTPCALVIRKDLFEPYGSKNKIKSLYILSREKAIQIIVDNLNLGDVVVSTTGKISRELFEYREKIKQGHNRDFLIVGSMGHCSQIALGIALSKPNRQIYCLDGDGAAIMHMGSLAIIGSKNIKNFKHIILNNGAHESVGGQPTAGFNIDFCSIAKACGYKTVLKAVDENEIKNRTVSLKSCSGPALLEIRINAFSRKELSRPTDSPLENKKKFMKFLQE